MTALAKELSTGVGEISDVLKSLEISDEEYVLITKHRRFATLMAQFKTEWESVDNTPKRIRMKAALALETCIAEMVTQVHNRETPLAARAALVTAMGKIAGLEKQPEQQNTGGGFKVTINLGDTTKPPVTIEAPTIEGEAL
ncbi:hypothetical protein [Methylocystis heyeri]|uniref:Uncharacterized protein n=1 Tax=Methylocystis heyeri TaxID=391905 RepID=A0A6B8KHY0_9HYPH|nr:hypothetical protein [Methylocystis heyeri]QGM46108.1 hypothetical protein H2LOC_010615 [Methylocystis heyeri]